MLIRPAALIEANLISALMYQSKAHWGYTPTQMTSWMPDLTVSENTITAGSVWVGDIDGQIVAVLVLKPAASIWELAHLFVANSAMRRGLGQQMFGHAVSVARAHGAVALDIDADPNAEAFYLVCGATRISTVAAPIETDPNRIRPQMRFMIKPYDGRPM